MRTPVAVAGEVGAECVAMAAEAMVVCEAAAEVVTMVVVEVVTTAGGRHYGGGGRHYGGGSRHYGGGSRHYGGGKHSSGKHHGHGHGHRYYRSGHGYGYWRGGVWITTGIIGYGAYAGSYCSRLYHYDYSRWLYECQY